MTQYTLDELQKLLPRRYELRKEIARGGMSRVYLARESHPDRLVAIKVMDGRLSERGRDRFLREVDVTSKLSHPHIVPIFAAGAVGDSLYYVMPYVEGDTLADRIAAQGPLPVDDAIGVAVSVARALHYAHERGVVHRDVKPDNIHFQGGHPLVTDFGIARALDEAASPVTEEGQPVGTLAYMAPEQASGSSAASAPADQYSLACVVFEMLTGEPPFQGKSAQSVLARHLSGSVPSVRTLRPSVPDGVEAVLQRALQKVPSDRFPSLEAFANALRSGYRPTDTLSSIPAASEEGPAPRPDDRPGRGWLRLAAAALVVALVVTALLVPFGEGPTELTAGDGYLTSVAVLSPQGQVVGDTGGVDAAAIADALANEISSTLAGVPWLDVKSYYSSRVLQDARLPVREVLDGLGVEHLIQVNLVVQGDRVGLRIGYIDENERQSPGLRREFPLGDWLDEQPRIAQEVAQDFVRRVGQDQTVALQARDTPGPGYRDYQIANEFLGRRTPAGVRRAIDAYWQALEKDPGYGPAYARLSQAYALALTYRYDVGVEEYTAAGLADALATRAIQESPNLAEGYASRSYLRALAAAPTSVAADDSRTAQRLEPNNPSVPSWSARIFTLQGDLERAYEEVIRGAELDPLHSGRQIAVAYQAFHVGRHEDAVAYSETALELEPALMLPRVLEARSLVLLGRSEECLSMELGPHQATRALCLWAHGERARASAIIQRLEASYPEKPDPDFTSVLVAEDLAVFYGYTGDAQAALRWIETAYDQSPTGVELRVLESDLFDPVRRAPGFQAAVAGLRDALWPRVSEAWSGPIERPTQP